MSNVLTQSQRVLIKEITNKVVFHLLILFGAFYFVVHVLDAVLVAANVTTDNTDYRGSRSGLEVRQDALTGCEYLAGSRGGLTPRLDHEGQHICGIPDKRFEVHP